MAEQKKKAVNPIKSFWVNILLLLVLTLFLPLVGIAVGLAYLLKVKVLGKGSQFDIRKVKYEYKATEHKHFVLFTIMMLVFPPVTIAIGVFYLVKSSEFEQEFGRYLIVCSFLYMILLSLIFNL